MRQKNRWSIRANIVGVLGLALAVAAAPAFAGTSAGAVGAPRILPVQNAPQVGMGNWIDHFDTYATGSQMHGQGGWEGWNGNAGAGALTSDLQARSAPNSVAIFGDSDLVQPYSGYNSGVWVYRAYLYLTSPYTDNVYFIITNVYPAANFQDWSVQLCFNGTLGIVGDDITGSCDTSTSLQFFTDQWIEIKVLIDLDSNLQTVYIDGQQLYQDTWTDHLGLGGALNVGAVDLFANLSVNEAYYDDISISNLPWNDDFETGDTQPWHVTSTP